MPLSEEKNFCHSRENGNLKPMDTFVSIIASIN